MPTLPVGTGDRAAELYYELRDGGEASTSDRSEVERLEVLMIMGFAATLECWEPQLDDLLKAASNEVPLKICLMDNRGVGRSSSPRARTAYSTTIMAADCIALMDELGWQKAHVVGHSMGGMIATMLAAKHPDRLHSLTLISVTGGRWQSLPTNWAAIKYAWQTFWASCIEDRAKVDLKFHFMKKTLNEVDRKYKRTRKSLLHEEYVEGQKGGGIGQPDHGFKGRMAQVGLPMALIRHPNPAMIKSRALRSAWEYSRGKPTCYPFSSLLEGDLDKYAKYKTIWGLKGQVRAVWTHRVTDNHVEAIKSGDFPIMVVHGRYDILAQPKYGERLATRLECPCMMLEGAHFVTRESGPEINVLLKQIIYHGQRIHANRRKYLDTVADKEKTAQQPGTSVEAITLLA